MNEMEFINLDRWNAGFFDHDFATLDEALIYACSKGQKEIGMYLRKEGYCVERVEIPIQKVLTYLYLKASKNFGIADVDINILKEEILQILFDRYEEESKIEAEVEEVYFM